MYEQTTPNPPAKVHGTETATGVFRPFKQKEGYQLIN